MVVKVVDARAAAMWIYVQKYRLQMLCSTVHTPSVRTEMPVVAPVLCCAVRCLLPEA